MCNYVETVCRLELPIAAATARNEQTTNIPADWPVPCPPKPDFWQQPQVHSNEGPEMSRKLTRRLDALGKGKSSGVVFLLF